MVSNTFSSKPSAWFKTKVFSPSLYIFSLIFLSAFLVGCGEGSSESSDKDITAFSFNGSSVIKPANITTTGVDITIHHNSTHLTPIIAHTGVDYTPRNVDINFTSLPNIYRVTAEDSTVKDYSVIVRRAFIVSNETELSNAIDTINTTANNRSYVTILITKDITLTENITIPSTWAGSNITLEKHNTNLSVVTITGLTINGTNTVTLINVQLGSIGLHNNNTNIACNDDWVYFKGYENLTDVNGTPEYTVTRISPPSVSGGSCCASIVQNLTNKYNTKGQRSLFGVNRLCETNNSIKFAFVPNGTFVMGSREDEPEELNRSKNEKPWHNVTITKDYYVGIYKLTQAEWKRVVEATSIDLNATPSCNYLQNATLVGAESGGIPRYSSEGCSYSDTVFANGTYKDTGTHPVDSVRWAEAQKFIDALNILEPNITIDGERYKYALPTEAQWERAIKADSTTTWYWGQDWWCGENAWNMLNECNFIETLKRAWFIPRLNYDNTLNQYLPNNVTRVQPVGQKPATAYGLYDMGSDFVSEWVQDYYDETFYREQEALLDDPVNDTDAYRHDASCKSIGLSGYEHVIRGGVKYAGWGLRSAFRTSRCENDAIGAPYLGYHIGFRLALVRAE